MSQTIVTNLIQNITGSFKKNLELVNVGYHATMTNNILKLSLSYNHKMNFKPPANITITTPKQTKIIIKNINQQLVNQITANIHK